jgi:trehalose 6-phosphate phosphatase
LTLFLDLDGTLAPFEQTPSLVMPEAKRTEALRAAGVRLEGRLAILSGRTLDDIDRILDGVVAAAAGVHGLERRSTDGAVTSRAGHPALDQVEGYLQTFAAGHEGVLVERKPQSVALHYRKAPSLGVEAVALSTRLASKWGLTVQNGRMVTELRTPGEDKGDALRAFMAEAPFRDGQPVMFGDDLTDEPAFKAADALGGFGVLVGPLRPTAATFHLPDVASVIAWLHVFGGAGAARVQKGAAKWRG